MSDDELAKLRALLEEEHAMISEALGASRDSAKGTELDQARIGRLSRMDALQSQAIAQGANRRLAEELREVEAALERIANGQYGVCESCGREIMMLRLEVCPTSPNCLACAKRQA